MVRDHLHAPQGLPEHEGQPKKNAETLKSLAVHPRFKRLMSSFRRPNPGRPPRIPRLSLRFTLKRKGSQGISLTLHKQKLILDFE
jgi:hypothetical protein